MKTRGFTTVFIAIIIMAIIFAFLSIIEISSIFAASSIAANVCSVAGRSVLSEFNKDLFVKYKIFALKKSETIIKNRLTFYISSSIGQKGSVVSLKLKDLIVNANSFSSSNCSNLISQMKKSCLSVDNYVFNMFSHELHQNTNSKKKNEIEYVLFAFETDEGNLRAAKAELFALRFAYHSANSLADSKKMQDLQSTFDAGSNGKSGTSQALEAIASESMQKANSDVNILISGGKIAENGMNKEYKDYLGDMLALVPEVIKANRIMRLIENNLSDISRIFSFSDFVYGFDMSASFDKRRFLMLDWHRFNYGTISQSFTYN